MTQTSLAFTADDLKTRLYQHFTPRWAPLTEVSVTDHDHPAAMLRRIDMLLIRKGGKHGLETVAIEIKVTRADFYRDLADPSKQDVWRGIAGQHAFAAPAGLLQREQIPPGSGLITVDPKAVRWALRAPKAAVNPPLPPQVLATLMYRLAQTEARLKGMSCITPGGDVEELRAELLTLATKHQKLTDQEARSSENASHWQAYAAALGGGLPCRYCDHLVMPVGNLKNGLFSRWKHTDPSDETLCQEIRKAAQERECARQWHQLNPHDRETYLSRNTDYGDRPWMALWPYAKADIGPADLPEPEETR